MSKCEPEKTPYLGTFHALIVSIKTEFISHKLYSRDFSTSFLKKISLWLIVSSKSSAINIISKFVILPAGNYMFKDNNRNIRTRLNMFIVSNKDTRTTRAVLIFENYISVLIQSRYVVVWNAPFHHQDHLDFAKHLINA